MLRRRLDLVGKKFGKLLVLEKSEERTKYGAVLWLCSCECGKSRLAISSNLTSGTATSCGCESYETRKLHGMTKTRTFKSWESMKQRCLNKNAPDYPHYGARGITIDERWAANFNSFLEDMGERPVDKTLDRKNVNGNYEPSNCRWATRSEQQRNKTNSLLIEWQGVARGAADWSDLVGIPAKIIFDRIRAGWTPSDALTKPNRKAKK